MMYSIFKNRYFTVLVTSVLLSINFLQAQTNVSGVISANTTWTLINSPYIVKSNILVNSGITLNIEPGVVVKFDDNVGIVVNGKIIGDGTPTNSIIFTSSNITPNAGDWAAIRLSTSASPSIWDGSKNYLSGSKFSYCKFEYAGNSAIYSEVSLYVNNSIFINNKNWGEYRKGIFQSGEQYYQAGGALTLKGGTSLIKNSLFYNNQCDNGYGHGLGGAIYSFGSDVLNCIFSNNIAIGNGEGGAIFVKGNSNRINNCSFINNIGVYNGSSIGVSNGGATIYNSTIYSKNVSGNGVLSNDMYGTITINNSNLLTSDNYIIKNRNNNNLDARTNFWSPIHINSILDKIYDFTNLSSLGTIDISSKLNVKDINAPISFPINVTKQIESGRVKLTWTANTESDIAGYKIYYGGFTGYSYANSVDAGNVLTYTLPAGVEITDDIAVTAYDASKDGTDDQYDGNESWYSPANKVPDAPTNLVADAGPRKIKLTWTASTSTGVDKYNVYKSTDGVNFTFLWSTNNTYTTEETRTPATKYYYKVTAFDSLDLSYDNYGLESEASSIVNAIPNRITYVSPTGDNANIGSVTSPKLTIANSITNSLAGDTVLLNRGTYNEVVDLKGKISLLSSLYINTGDTNDITSTILSGSTTGNNTLIINTGTPAIASHHIYALTIQDVRLQVVNLNSGNDTYVFKLSKSIIKNSGSYGQWGVIALGNYGVLDSCRIFGNKARYIIGNDRNSGTMASIISNNTFYGNSSSVDGNTYDDVSVIHVEQPKSRVFNNLLFRNLTTAIDFGLNGSDSMIFINNTIALNKGYGVKFTSNGSPYGGYLINNIIKFNTQIDIFTNVANNGPDVYIKNNFFGTSGSLFGTNLQDVSKVTILDTTGNIGGDPYFVDTLNNNYRLKAQSRAIGAGATHTYPNSKDIEGNDRINPWRLKPDIGAFESAYKFTSPLLTKTEPGNKKVAIFWSQTPNTNIKAYKVFRSTSTIPDINTSTFIADVTGVATLSYTDESADLVNGTTYYYRLKAVHNDNSISGLSNELTAIPADVAIPTNFKLDNGPATARLDWTSVGLTGAKYQLFRGTNLNTKTLLVDSLNAITYDDATLARNTTYYFWIKAMNATGALSEFSAPITLTPTNIWYVDSATGNNTTGLGSFALPYLKIQKGIDKSINGDTVYVKQGTYNESILINKSILVKSTDGVAKTKLIQESGIGYSIKVFNPAFSDPYTTTRINGFYMKGTGNSSNSTGLRVEQKAYATIDNVFMDSYDLALSTYYGYYSVNNSIFYGNRIFAYGDAGDVDKSNIVQNSTIINTIWSVYEASTNSTNKYYNLIITNEKSKPFQSPNPFNGPRPFLYNVILDKTFANYNPQDGSTKFIVDDAESMRFKNLALKDFRLENTSPAIGFGNTTLTNAFDYDGQPRPNPNGSNPDAGAFENIYDHSAPYIDTDSSRNGFVLLKMTQTPAGTVNKINIYKGLTSAPTTKYKDTTLVSKYADSLNTIFNKVIYYRLTSVGTSNLESGYSNEVRTISFTPPSLNFPTDLSVNVDTNINFQWEKIDNATNYKIQYSTDSNFVNSVVEIAKTDTSHLKTSLVDNTSYFWRLQTLDSVHYSKWSNFKRFQTFVRKPILNTISTVNRVVTINWSVNSLRNIKAFKIYRGTGTNPTTKIDSISSANLTYNDSVTNGVKYYYRVTSVNTDNIESLYSNELFANSFGVTILDSPSNKKVKEILNPNFKWQTVEFATKNNIQISTDSLFSISPVLDTVTALTNLIYTKGLSDNTTYYWRIRVGDDNGYGNWTSKSIFQTYVLAPNLISVSPSNKIDTLKWSVLSTNNIKYFKIYRDTINNPKVLLDSVSGSLRTYIDTTKLQLNIKYYYSIITGNNENIESLYSNVSFATPFNTKPKTVTLSSKSYNNVGEFNYVRTTYSSTGSIDTDGKITEYKWFVNDSLVNSTDSILIYYYNQGSNKVKLVITDNDGGKDSSSTTVSLSSFIKTYRGGFLGGITALSQNLIYTADSTFDAISGASISMLDRAGNTIYPLVVSSKIFTTPSVSSDSSVFITNGSSLNGFNKFGAPLWSTIPLGGLSYVTPTIDSLLTRIYVGVSNKNFFAIDYKTGKIAWSIFGDAPVNASAVITGDRKLVFTSQNGTLYGFDIRTNVAQTSAKWSTNFGEVVTKSPAVDALNNLIIGTESGKVLKIKLNADGTVTKIWTISINAEIQSSPVIDADGYIYIGNKLGDFYKLNPDNGAIVWKYSTGAAIKSTPTISDFGSIYISNSNGLVTALTTDKTIKWTYQADGPISANMLYISNMLYIGTETGKFFAIYDNPNTNTVNTGLSININKNNFTSYNTGSLASVLQSSIKPEYQYYYESFRNGAFNFTIGDQVVKPKKPVWGTFQGNNQRTGSATFECPETPFVKTPNCVETADTIKISTNNLTNKYWVINDVVLDKVTDTSIYIKSTDKYKLMAYNSNGCNVYSNENVLIPNSAISKPKITTSTGNSKFCEGDSIILSSSISASKYQWNYSSSVITDANVKNFSTTLQGAYSLTAINEYGCKATSDVSLILSTPKPSVAAIDGINSLCLGATIKLTNSTVGGIWSSVATTIVKVDAVGNVSSVAPGTGTVNYTITANGCSNNSKINIKVNETPAAPKADNVALCIGGTSSALIANALGGHSLLWYGSNATGGQASGTAPLPSTTTQGSTDYYVSQSNNSTTCESPRTKLTVSVGPAPTTPTITRDANGNLTSSATSGNQWYKNGSEINGANSSIYKPTEVANYAVKVQGACVSPMSATYYFLITDVINLSATEFIKLAPNPFQSKLNFDFVIKGYQKLNLDVFEMASGRKVTSRAGLTPGSPVYLPELTGGTYIVRITSADGKLSYQFKMMKL